MDFAPNKPNNGKMNLAQRQHFETQPSPSRFQSVPNAPTKKTVTKRARDELGPEPVSPFKSRKTCPDAPKKNTILRSFIRTYKEDSNDWLLDSYIETNPYHRPITWAPHKKDTRYFAYVDQFVYLKKINDEITKYNLKKIDL